MLVLGSFTGKNLQAKTGVHRNSEFWNVADRQLEQPKKFQKLNSQNLTGLRLRSMIYFSKSDIHIDNKYAKYC